MRFGEFTTDRLALPPVGPGLNKKLSFKFPEK